MSVNNIEEILDSFETGDELRLIIHSNNKENKVINCFSKPTQDNQQQSIIINIPYSSIRAFKL